MSAIILDDGVCRESWLAARRRIVTATDAVALAGLSPYCQPHAVYARKMTVSEPSPAMIAGSKYEVLALDMFRRVTRLQIPRNTALYADGWRGGTPDAFSIRHDCVVEVKCTKAWTPEKEKAARAQIAWYQALMEVEYGWLVVLNYATGKLLRCDGVPYQPNVAMLLVETAHPYAIKWGLCEDVKI